MRIAILASELTGCLGKIAPILDEHARRGRVLYIPTAARGEGWEPDIAGTSEQFAEVGYEIEAFDLEGKERADVEAALSRSAVVYLGGGNTFYLLHHMKASGLFDIVGDHMDRGLVYMGSSAGSVAASPDIAYASTVDDPSKGGGLGTAGLAFCPVPILPHMDHPFMGGAVCAIADGFTAGGQDFIGLNDDQLYLLVGSDGRVV